MLRTNSDLVTRVKALYLETQPNNTRLIESTDWSYSAVQLHLQVGSNARVFSTSRKGGLYSFVTSNGRGTSLFKNFKQLRAAILPDMEEHYSWRNDIENALLTDFLFHWTDNFIEYQTWEDLNAKLQDPAAGLSLATVMYVNMRIYDGAPTIALRKALKKAKYNWISREGFWVPTKFYTLDAFGRAAVYSRNQTKFSEGRLKTFRAVLQQDIEALLNVTASLRARESLLSYNTKATDYLPFKSEPKKQHTTFLGVELELENFDTTAAEALATLQGHAILKRDGSLTAGVEICTAPATLTLHKEAFKPFFEANKTLEAKDNCGLHVHVDKTNMTKLHLANLHIFMNSDVNEKHIIKIAGRPGNQYCARSKLEYFHFNQRGVPSSNRYTRINHLNSATVEFRLYASTTSFEDFCKRLEFTQAVVDYTKPGAANVSIKNILQWDQFKSYVGSNHSLYPTLFKEMYNDTL